MTTERHCPGHTRVKGHNESCPDKKDRFLYRSQESNLDEKDPPTSIVVRNGHDKVKRVA